MFLISSHSCGQMVTIWEGLGHTLALQCREGGLALGLVLRYWVLVEPWCLKNRLVDS